MQHHRQLGSFVIDQFCCFQTNYTDLGEFTVFRGKKVSRDIGRVVAFNGDTEMDTYDDDECNQYVGTDSTIFPPFLKKEEGIWAHEPSMCRALGLTYKSKAKYNGIPVLRYELEIRLFGRFSIRF